MHRVSAWLDARSAPVVATVLFAIAGLGYALLWATLAHHGWHSYSDLWNSAGLSLSIGHGHWSAVYAPPSQLDAPPGFEVLLAPVMVAGHALGLATTNAEGTSYKAFGLILAPVATVMAASVLFALDAVARRWALLRGSPSRTLAGGRDRRRHRSGLLGATPRTASPSRSWCGRRWWSIATASAVCTERPGCSASPSPASPWRCWRWHP